MILEFCFYGELINCSPALQRDRGGGEFQCPGCEPAAGEAVGLCTAASLSLAANADVLSLHTKGLLLPRRPLGKDCWGRHI